MTSPEADLTGWTAEPFTTAGFTYDVYRKGEGPGVVLIPEMPGLHPGVLALGNHLVDNGLPSPPRRCSARRARRRSGQAWCRCCCVVVSHGNSRRSPPMRTGRWRTF
jgi:hypothetical protein